MSDINDKVIDIFKAHTKDDGLKSSRRKKTPEVKFYAGVDYVRLDEDINGLPFNRDALVEGAQHYSYIVRVLKPKNGKQSLYNYNVPYDKIVQFISMFATNELSGTIIEIDKYKPNELA